MTIRSRRQQPFIWIDLALDDFGLGVDAFRVYVHLCRRAGKDGNAFPSYASIGEHCFRCDSPSAKPESLRRRAIRAIGELIEKGLIERESRSKESGADTSNNYWINDLKDLKDVINESAGDCKSPHPGDCKSPPPVTVNHPPGDCKSPPYIEVDPIQTKPSEVNPPTPQTGEVSEADFIECEVMDPEPCKAQPTNGTKSANLSEQKKDSGGDKFSALAVADPFLNRRSSLSLQKEKALNESLLGSPFDSIASQDEFFAQYLDYIRATSPHLNPGMVTAIAKVAMTRIMAGITEPEDRRILALWEKGILQQFKGAEYSKEANNKAHRRAKALEILEKLEKGENLYV